MLKYFLADLRKVFACKITIFADLRKVFACTVAFVLKYVKFAEVNAILEPANLM